MKESWRTPALVMMSGAVILLLSTGVRQTLGLFLHPITSELGWGRETFSIAVAIQALLIGLVPPFFGMVADKYGSGRVIATGALGYFVALYLMSSVSSPLIWNLSAGVLLGISMGATGASIVAGSVGRAVPEHKRSAALGMVIAGAGVGQFLMIIFGQALIAFTGWQQALLILAALPLVMLPLASVLAGKPEERTEMGRVNLRQALAEAGGHRSYRLLTAGFFVCGFHVVFIAAHLPAYLVDMALSPAVGATALALIGFFNIIGSFLFGYLGGKFSKKKLLSLIYLARAVVIAVFISVPISNVSALLFGAMIGFLWLGTVPLTSALVGQIFGVQYLSTLFGIVFLSHQVGSFLGVWLGGYLFDLTGSYDVVWYIAVALGVFAALVHWPINERQVERLRPSEATA
jgi:predicted MFS family arabinose efflux permease